MNSHRLAPGAFEISGEVTFETLASFSRGLHRLGDGSPHWLVILPPTFMLSPMLSLMLSIWRRAQSMGCTVSFRCSAPSLASALHFSDLEKFLPLEVPS